MQTKQKKIFIPEISDQLLAKRMKQIRYVTRAMQGVNGKIYGTEEKNERLYDLFYMKTSCDPRTDAFNFDETSKIVEKADQLKELLITNIFVKIGGYYGFCKISYAEVFSQLPKEIASKTVAFALNPKVDSQILNGEYQSTSIIFYGEGTTNTNEGSDLPSYKELMKPIDFQKARNFRNKIYPVLPFSDHSLKFVDPGNINKPFMQVGIWLRINGSNLHKKNALTPLKTTFKHGESFSVYQVFSDETGADFFTPTYAYLISQVPEHLLDENVIGLRYYSTDYFKVKEGVLHKTEYTIIKKR